LHSLQDPSCGLLTKQNKKKQQQKSAKPTRKKEPKELIEKNLERF